ncbi:MAG TPA: redoxin domain-containing protein [Acidobacteriaceae bacterium]
MSRRVLVLPRQLLAIAVVVCCLALLFWSGYQHRMRSSITASAPSVTTVASSGQQSTDADISPLLHKAAPDFALRDLAGHSASLADYRGKAVLINFWATWCAPCRVEMPWFIELQQKYSAQGFVILGIDSDYPEDVPKVPGFAKKMGLNYPVLYGNQQTATKYGCCDYLPMSYYIDRAGIVRFATVGLRDRNTLESYVQELLGPPSPSQPDTQITASTAADPSRPTP